MDPPSTHSPHANRSLLAHLLLLRVQLLQRCQPFVPFNIDPLPDLSSLWRVDGLYASLLALPGRSAQQHSVRLDTAHGYWLQVADAHNHTVTHRVDGDVVHEAGENDSGAFGFAEVDLLRREG